MNINIFNVCFRFTVGLSHGPRKRGFKNALEPYHAVVNTVVKKKFINLFYT